MEKDKFSVAVVRMPSNRVSGFLKDLPKNVSSHEALVYGIRCREEAFAFVNPKPELVAYLKNYPLYAAVRYCELKFNASAVSKVCHFDMKFVDEPQLCAVWCQCCKVIAGFSSEELKKLNFALYVNDEEKTVSFLSYSLANDDAWTRMMLNFVHNIQPDNGEWEASDIEFTTCDINMNF